MVSVQPWRNDGSSVVLTALVQLDAGRTHTHILRKHTEQIRLLTV